MRFNYPLQAFLAGKLSLHDLQDAYSQTAGEELFVAVASLSGEQRQQLREAVFAASLLTAIAVHYECPVVEFGRFVQQQINRAEMLL